MMDRLLKLPGNLLQSIVGILPSDKDGAMAKPRRGADLKEWCESMGGKVMPGPDGEEFCALPVSQTNFQQLNDAAFGRQASLDNAIQESRFIDEFNTYMGKKP